MIGGRALRTLHSEDDTLARIIGGGPFRTRHAGDVQAFGRAEEGTLRIQKLNRACCFRIDPWGDQNLGPAFPTAEKARAACLDFDFSLVATTNDGYERITRLPGVEAYEAEV